MLVEMAGKESRKDDEGKGMEVPTKMKKMLSKEMKKFFGTIGVDKISARVILNLKGQQ